MAAGSPRNYIHLVLDLSAFDDVLLRCLQVIGPRYASKRDVLALLFRECRDGSEALTLFHAAFDEHGDDAALSSEGLRVAIEAAEQKSVGPIAVVTKRFLQDVLAEADLPDELIDVIVDAYGSSGAITMSEDGGRYIVHLPPGQ